MSERHSQLANLLFDLEKDPAENVNVARKPEYAEVVEEMRQVLADGWKAALPNPLT